MDTRLGGQDACRISARTVAPKHQRDRSIFAGPRSPLLCVCLAAVAKVYDRLHLCPRPDTACRAASQWEPALRYNSSGEWAQVCVVIPLAMRVMMGRPFLLPNELRTSSLPCTHSLFAACFYEPPFIRSPDSTRTYTLVRVRARARSTHAASYQACFPCCRSMRHRGWMYMCMYVQYSVAAEALLLVNCVAEPSRYLQVGTPSLNSVPLWRRPTLA